MKINGRILQPHETELFYTNPLNSSGIRVSTFLVDTIIFVTMLITVFTIGGWAVIPFYVIYTLQALLILLAFVVFVNKDVRAVDHEMRNRLLSCANSSVDWPFGFLGLFNTTKNFIIALAAIPLVMHGEIFLAVLLPCCWLLNNLTIHARGTLTLKVLDHTLKQGQYAV